MAAEGAWRSGLVARGGGCPGDGVRGSAKRRLWGCNTPEAKSELRGREQSVEKFMGTDSMCETGGVRAVSRGLQKGITKWCLRYGL